MRIALDAMGGDYAPDPNIDGALAALELQPELQIALVGDQETLEKQLADRNVSDDRLSIVASEGVVGMDEKPTEALRKKPNSSISVSWQLMAGEKVDAVVSAGNTGAVVAAGLRTRLFLKGIKRPGIAVALPTAKGRSVLIDVGANPAARAEHLGQYAVMGSIYAQNVLGIENPSIGLMNIGSEDSKGTELYRETHKLLSEGPMKDRYVGNVEGRGLYQGEADVLVCEGFVGNVVLKVSEGMASYMLKALSEAVLSKLDVERAQAGKAFQEIGRSYQHNEEGGAPLLGIDGICIICHGSSDARSITNAIKVATAFKDRQINSQITEALS
ncbi:MAG: phosphate acyltransferase PlsX [Planctomycetaceae bacterium]|nr:phosphate acyltransferase PlsX [Planctomycetaceae bacterium]